jgi:peptide deformylase
MALRRIRIHPDPVLRAKCAAVTVFDDGLRQLVADMVETMHAAPGIGLAASQIGVEQRVAVVDLSVGANAADLLVLVNPRVETAEKLATENEGCLSLPGIEDKVERPEQVRVFAQDVDGRAFELAADGWLARAIQHEVDHLDGILFTDRLRGLRRERARRLLRKLAEESGG